MYLNYFSKIIIIYIFLIKKWSSKKSPNRRTTLVNTNIRLSLPHDENQIENIYIIHFMYKII